MNVKETIGDMSWLKENESKIKDVFPKTYTHMENLNQLEIGFKFKLIGLDWRSTDELARLLCVFEKIGFILREGYSVKRNHRLVLR